MEKSPRRRPLCSAIRSALKATARTAGRNRWRSCQKMAREYGMVALPADSTLRRAGRKALFILAGPRHSPGEVTHDEAIDEPGFLDLGGMAAARDHQELALG